MGVSTHLRYSDPMKAPTPAKPLPVYLQIAELLTRQIKAGYWQSGERLPTEAELADSLSVAVGTLRKGDALDVDYLPGQGTLLRFNGKAMGVPIPGDDFYQTLLKIFIGDRPVDNRLKEGLLRGR